MKNVVNINEYLVWRGDIPINNDYPFNEVDSMVLARFSYLIFSKIEMNKKETIGSISNKMKDFKNEEFLYNGDKELITNLGKSSRFNNLIVTDYIENVDEEIEKQFGAITIHLPKHEMYISYLGTDFTINGWKEDFNMAFMDNVPCQIAGKEYLEKIANKYNYKNIRIGGHSKGGNVAIYSAITVSKKIQNRIIKVYNYDGPGFSKNIINKYENDDIINKIETYIPQDSIIGRVLNHKEKMTIALSYEKGILQHDIFSWQVSKNDLVKSEKYSSESENIDQALTNWLESTTNEQRKVFVNVIFELFYSTNATTFMEISKNLKTSLPLILAKYKEISLEDKKDVADMIKLLITCYVDNIKNQEINKLSNIKTKYITKTKRKVKEIDEKYFMKLRKNKNTIIEENKN